MTYLLDTHIMFWIITDTRKLTRRVKDIIADPDNTIIVSTVSFWEVSLKCSLGKLEIMERSPDDLPGACLQIGFEIEPLSAGDSSTFHNLKATYHKDPFDRMLIWQAIRNNYTLISADKDVKKYASEGLKVLTA
ncbi:MAG: DNA-binding protein [Flavipsychrobacter sp.]|jgi:PIN domain nuclease of toxin-antitoxin system|nr:DNA-binding protein [Flavipsychrobacter sp.]